MAVEPVTCDAYILEDLNKSTCGSVRMMEKIKRSQREPRASAYRWSGRITSAAFVAFFFRCRCFFVVAATSPDAQSKRDGHHRYGCCHGGCGGCSCSHNYLRHCYVHNVRHHCGEVSELREKNSA